MVAKKAFSLLELIFAIVIISIIYSFSTYKNINSNLYDASNRLKLYLNYTRYISFLDTKDDIDKSWTLKFQRCSSKVGGLYFVVYSDNDTSSTHFKKTDCLKDPLTNKYLYSNYDCDASYDESKYILLTKEYGVEKVDISCNTTSTIGQISFGSDHSVYSRLGSSKVKITKPCKITLYDKNNNKKDITIETTGYVW